MVKMHFFDFDDIHLYIYIYMYFFFFRKKTYLIAQNDPIKVKWNTSASVTQI